MEAIELRRKRLRIGKCAKTFEILGHIFAGSSRCRRRPSLLSSLMKAELRPGNCSTVRFADLLPGGANREVFPDAQPGKGDFCEHVRVAPVAGEGSRHQHAATAGQRAPTHSPDRLQCGQTEARLHHSTRSV